MIKKPHQLPTQKAVAEAVGLSRASVSHILSGREADRYTDETRRKVLAAAKRLGYRPHRAAQLMRKGRSNLIGIIHFGAAHQTARQSAHFLPQAIVSRGYETLVVDLSWHGNSYARAIEHLIDSRVEGLIVSQLVETFGANELDIIARAGIPTVMLADNEKLGLPIVSSNVRAIFCRMTEHLRAHGHRRLLLLTNDYEAGPTLNRIAGFNDALKIHGDLDGKIVRLPADRGMLDPGMQAYHYMRQLIASGSLPDAILCSNDQWARGVFSAALEGGVQIPRDVAVTGFDNEYFGAHAPYYLTTATPNMAVKCEKVVELLVETMAGNPLPKMHYLYPCELIVRGSCGAAMHDPVSPSPLSAPDHI